MRRLTAFPPNLSKERQSLLAKIADGVGERVETDFDLLVLGDGFSYEPHGFDMSVSVSWEMAEDVTDDVVDILVKSTNNRRVG